MSTTCGQVKWYSETHGYGFVATNYGDVFVHYTAIKNAKSLKEGQQVYIEYKGQTNNMQAVQCEVRS